MSAIPLDSDPIFCRDTIICAAAAVDEDDDNKLESTAEITNRDRSEDARTEREEAEGIAGSSSGRDGGRSDGGKRAELSLFMPPKEIENGREKSDAKSSCPPSFLPASLVHHAKHCNSLRSSDMAFPFRDFSFSPLSFLPSSSFLGPNTPGSRSSAERATYTMQPRHGHRHGVEQGRYNHNRAVMTGRHDI